MIRSIEDEGCSHFERRMLANYGLDEVKLRRLGYFFLVHSHIDTKLIALVVKSETVKLGQHRELAYDDHALLSRKWSRGTFKLHLRHAGERNLLEPEEFRIAEETNRARDHFVHFEVRRFQLPPVLRERCDQRGRVSSLPPRRHNVRRERPVPELLTKAKRTIPPPASGTPGSASTRPARDAADAMERRGSSSVSSSGGRSRSGARSDARGGSTTRG